MKGDKIIIGKGRKQDLAGLLFYLLRSLSGLEAAPLSLSCSLGFITHLSLVVI